LGLLCPDDSNSVESSGMNGNHKWYSQRLSQDFELKVYGHAGKPLLAFPSVGGRFFDFENFGMVEACREYLDAGRLRIIAVDGRDWESWTNAGAHPAERGRRHASWESCLLHEVIPFIGTLTGGSAPRRMIVTGCSGGAFHAGNFFFRHPDVFDSVIALSGLYSPKFLFGDYWEDSLYFHFPLAYLPGLGDERQLELIRRAKIVLCVGQGAWERCDQYDCIGETLAMKNVMEAKGIPCWVDLWGQDAQHEWYWWRRQMPYFLGHLL